MQFKRRRDPSARRGTLAHRIAAATTTALALAALTPVAASTSAAFPPAVAAAATTSGGRQVAGSVPAPIGSSLTPNCGNPAPLSTLGPAPSLPTDPTQPLVNPSGGIVDFAVTTQSIYVETPTELEISTLDGKPIRSFTLPSALQSTSLNASSLVVDSSGSSYVASYQNRVIDKFSSDGKLLWHKATSANPTGVFGLSETQGFRLAVSFVQDKGHSELFDTSGRRAGTTPVTTAANGFVTQLTDGDLLVAADGHVRQLDHTGRKLLHEFGATSVAGAETHTGGPYAFYYQGQAVAGPDGTLYTADPITAIESSTAEGLLTASTDLGGKLSLAGGHLYLIGGKLYFEGGQIYSPDVNVSSVSLDTLRAYLAPPRPTLLARTLGWGAGLATTADANYFPAGTSPKVYAAFAPWWTEEAARGLRLSYSVWTTTTLAHSAPPLRSVTLPHQAPGLAHVPLALPRTDTTPGPYEVSASLYDTSVTPAQLLGTTCLPYSVGARGDRLDLRALPRGSDAGGAADPRGVALNAQLGLDGLRGAGIEWSTFLPHCDAGNPSDSTCGPAAMDFASAPQSYFRAAKLAVQQHVAYWVQVSGGDATSMALVKGGWWQSDVVALVSYYSHPPSACTACAPVTAWEPWNEPNDTGFSDGSTYLAEVLKPFFTAVKSAAATDTVIGGSTLEIPADWWQSFIAAGGLSDLDVVAVHPYTGNNDSFEEDGILTQVRRLQGEIGKTPLWFTEVGWWGDGDYNLLNQGDNVARALLWQRILGVPVWSYYYAEGSAPPGSVSFTLIQTDNRGDDYVKSGALASMVADAQLASRPPPTMTTTGIPHTYAASFGPTPGGSTALVAAWSDGWSTVAKVTVTSPDGSPVPTTLVDQYGGTRPVRLKSGATYALPLSGQVTYLRYPAGDVLRLAPTESYGADLATAATGARAGASSGNASAAIAGTATGTGWSSKAGDTRPTLTVTLPNARTIDRIVVDTQSPGSTAPGVRDYTVSVKRPGHGQAWTVVARVVGQFRDHVRQIAITPTRLNAVRVTVTEISYGGYANGGIPNFWSAGEYAGAFLHSLEVYAGTSRPAQVMGAGLLPLPG